ncbi:MAG: divalent-cation tolerance protein CutA [Candidatus Methylacidiphilales bacterium]|nr:divalent-cation tolerance protein CutA [Candidatus Methylacidiphilales bacterium]
MAAMQQRIARQPGTVHTARVTPLSEPVLVLTTAASKAEGEFLAGQIVNARLAACVNVLPGMESYYWWKGSMQVDREALLMIKTAVHLVDDLTDLIRAKHSYECPEVVAIKPDAIAPHYLAWWRENLSAGNS